MEILDGTVIAPAAPSIAADFGVAPVDVNEAITAYALITAIPFLLPLFLQVGFGWSASRAGLPRPAGDALTGR
ncbi:hypothetical protein [Cryptosporangium arvum]|uniref:hypothetical protein n=1 Tax=Cryptosporangium arvum TaxID=80871 RepID=UPI0004BC54FC|nr:hypothetical protein [Cryptosporangium arvum]